MVNLPKYFLIPYVPYTNFLDFSDIFLIFFWYFCSILLVDFWYFRGTMPLCKLNHNKPNLRQKLIEISVSFDFVVLGMRFA